jgi:hypothetical protein
MVVDETDVVEHSFGPSEDIVGLWNLSLLASIKVPNFIFIFLVFVLFLVSFFIILCLCLDVVVVVVVVGRTDRTR